MTAAELIAQWPVVACFPVTLAAFAAAGPADDRRSRLRTAVVPAIVAAALVAATLLLFPGTPASQDGPVPHASYGASNALVQLAINAAFAAPFVLWVVWRRRGAAALGVGRQDALRSLAVGACVSLACIAILDRLSLPFWSSPGTWWLLLAMLGVGASEELVFRGLLLGSLARRLPRVAAEVCSAAVFSVVHVPQRLGGGLSATEIALSLVLLFVWGWCYAAAMRKGRNVPGLALVHAIVNVCGSS